MPNSGPEACDEMSLKIGLARQDDLPENSEISVNDASDFTLLHSLARRGYDVKLSTPTTKMLEKRRKAHEAAKARRAAFEKKVATRGK